MWAQQALRQQLMHKSITIVCAMVDGIIISPTDQERRGRRDDGRDFSAKNLPPLPPLFSDPSPPPERLPSSINCPLGFKPTDWCGGHEPPLYEEPRRLPNKFKLKFGSSLSVGRALPQLLLVWAFLWRQKKVFLLLLPSLCVDLCKLFFLSVSQVVVGASFF